ncbi:MAG: 4-hydroxy-3-methylbut-2-enyl diphosphate reductase [Planctomycetota bacterium]|jgi:4-hydroxy-3-methylbut-2-enyl diphosphate reductase|nr:4-hydroxy-3-methylbut-2-enyl diphosphate reductase [Planctomycetota bacterium]MDP7254088.1 4-hydroxy-3-methylbut-2-enyl diphosphate reductase [Planctomycetota bacterium]
MRVILASHMGMCFGVKDAIDMTESVEEPGLVTIHGELVHNAGVQERFKERGFHSVNEALRDGLPNSPFVLITAHGVSDTERSRLEESGKLLIDTTCPLVRRVHQAALHLQSEGCLVLIAGRHGHVEVEGIIGDLQDYTVIQSPDDVQVFGHGRIGIVSQSTTPPWLFDEICAEVRRTNPGKEIKVIDTVCAPTRERQEAVQELLDVVEALVVVGGKNSNNTRQLCHQAELRGVPFFHVQDEHGLDAEVLLRFEVVGLTAGTSTPDSSIEKVHQALMELGKAERSLPRRISPREGVTFTGRVASTSKVPH